MNKLIPIDTRVVVVACKFNPEYIGEFGTVIGYVSKDEYKVKMDDLFHEDGNIWEAARHVIRPIGDDDKKTMEDMFNKIKGPRKKKMTIMDFANSYNINQIKINGHKTKG